MSNCRRNTFRKMSLNGKCDNGMKLDPIYNSVTKTGKDDAKGARSTVEQKPQDLSTGEHGSYENPGSYENVIGKMDELKITANYKNEENHIYENVSRETDVQEVKHSSTSNGLGENMCKSGDRPVDGYAFRKTAEQEDPSSTRLSEENSVYENVIRKTNEGVVQDEIHIYENAIRKTTEEEILGSTRGKGGSEENSIYENVIRKTSEQEIQELARQKYQSGENHVYENTIRKTIGENIPSSSRGKCEIDESPVYENVTRKIDKQDTTDPPIMKHGGKAVQAYERVPDAVIKTGHYEADNEIEPITNLNQ